MRQASRAADEAQATKIVDALLVLGIDAEARESEVWVHDNAQLEAARAHIARFEQQGVPDAARDAKRIRRRRARGEADWAHRFTDVSRRWHVAKSIGEGMGALTLLLVAGSVVVALFGLYGEGMDERMWNLTIDHPASTVPLQRVREGEVWRIFTPIFLHFGFFHILFNCLWLLRLGNQVERNDGFWVMLALVVTSAAAGNLAQYYVWGPSFGGLSGVVYGVFGFAWMQSRYRPGRVYDVPSYGVPMMMIWFFLGTTGLIGGIANLGHAGGLVAGLGLGLPAYVGYLRARTDRPTYEDDGAWASTHVRGFTRLKRRFIDPYVPAWFLVLIVLAVVFEHDEQDATEACVESLTTVMQACEAELAAEGDPEAWHQAVYELATDPIDPPHSCDDWLEAVEALAGRMGCDD